MLFLVVRSPFGLYERGDIITDSNAINAVRTSEHYSQVVMVSDEPIPPPQQPPPPPDFASLQRAWQEQQELIIAQQAALQSAVNVNNAQATQLTQQALEITSLNAALAALEAKVDNLPGGGTPLPPNLQDDVPLSEDDNVVLATNSGAILAGDIRNP